MTDEQSQALEALYKAAGGNNNRLVDRERVPVSLRAGILDDLLKQGFIRTVGRGNFTMTPQEIEKASENQRKPLADG